MQPTTIQDEGITSPSLQESISVPIVLEPRVSVNATHGHWERRSTMRVHMDGIPSTHLNINSSSVFGTRVVPVRLPAMRNDQPLAHAVVSNLSRNVLTPTLITNNTKSGSVCQDLEQTTGYVILHDTTPFHRSVKVDGTKSSRYCDCVHCAALDCT